VRLNGGFASAVTPSDKWSTGFRVGIPTQEIRYDESSLQTFINAVAAAAGTMHASNAMAAGTNCYFLGATVARVGTNGKYNPAEQLTTNSIGYGGAGGGAPTQPWNTALSFGLRTASPRGHASNGRLYYPMLAAPVVSSTGRLAAGTVGSRLTPFKTFLNAVNTACSVYELGSMVCVMSNVGMGTTRPVTAIRSDDRLDSIERRENALPPNYQTVAI